jgi:hypothetical protein
MLDRFEFLELDSLVSEEKNPDIDDFSNSEKNFYHNSWTFFTKQSMECQDFLSTSVMQLECLARVMQFMFLNHSSGQKGGYTNHHCLVCLLGCAGMSQMSALQESRST